MISSGLYGLRFEGPGEVLRPRVVLLVGALVLFAGSLVLMGVGAPGWSVAVEQGLAAWLVGAFAWRAYRSSLKGVVHADASGLRVGETVVAERSRIASAFLLTPESPVVRLMMRRGLSVDVRLESEEKARALLTALGLGTGEGIATFSAFVGGRGRLVLVGSLALGAASGGVFASHLLHGNLTWPTLVALVLVATTGVGFFLRAVARVDVGSDGILLHHRWRQRFIPYGSMTGTLALGPDSIQIGLRGERELRLTLEAWTDKAQMRDALVERIEEARTAFASGVGTGGPEALVAPGGREVGRWLREVRALARAKHYRETRLDRERLWRVVDDAGAPPATRAGAALALAELDEPGRARLRVAAEACAEPRLRVALARVAEGAPDAEVEEALGPLLGSKG